MQFTKAPTAPASTVQNQFHFEEKSEVQADLVNVFTALEGHCHITIHIV
jgi:hypothetical protein